MALILCVHALPLRAQTRTPERNPAPVSVARTAPANATATGQTLPIRRVILYSNGVAYIERRGTVNGRAEVNLSFKQSQVDDVLKSMVVLDLGQGRIGAVSYNSSAPPAARMADIPFSISAKTTAAGGLAQVLSQLQGAKVLVTGANRTASGAVLTVEEIKLQPADSSKPPTIKHALVIAADGGELVNFPLDEVRSVKILDEGAQRDVNEFADATAAARRRDAKTITVTSDGAGAREMVVSYTIAAPIWKTTYRVVLDQAGQPFFQGWAIVDNVSEEDWDNVQLSLVSGTPVSFIQPLQQPFYRYRPVVPMPSDLKLEPQVYEPESGVSANEGGAMVETTVSAIADSSVVMQRQVQELPINGRNANGFALSVGGIASNEMNMPSPATTTVSDAFRSGATGVETAAEGAEVGDLFEYKIAQPITVKRNRSALIPIVQTKMQGERASIYNESVRRDRALGGMLLKNNTPLTLESGALTVIDGDAYAGEALMERLKPNEQRLISFALDLGTLVTVRNKQERAPTFLVRAVNGVFQAHYYQTDQKVYLLTNQTDKPRTVYLEHPVREGWEIAKESTQPTNSTQRYHRFRVVLEPRSTQTIDVIERRALMDTYEISNFTRRDLELFISRRYIDDATRAVFEKILALKDQATAVEAQLAALNEETETITKDQERLRENIEALKNTAEARQLIARYVAKADAQETRLEAIEKEKKAAQAELTRLQTELGVNVRGVNLERKL